MERTVVVVVGSLGLLGALAAAAPAVDAAAHPPMAPRTGVIVHRVPVPSLLQRLLGRAVYTASPSIAILPNGPYVISSNLFGSGSGADRSGTTLIHRSEDGGQHWRQLTTVKDMKRGSLFLHGGALYLWGYTAAPGAIVIRRSVDGGETWTEPRDAASGLLRPGTFGGTPCRPVVHGGRLWVAQGGRRLMSAPVDADLLQASSWTLSRAADTHSGPLGPDVIVTEAQVVAAPQTGVVLLPKVHGLPYTVLIRAGKRPEYVQDPRPEDWVPFPGGEKKFAATYDPVSATFYALANPVDPADAERGWSPELVRNTAALLSSPDLRHWRLERVFLHTPDVDHEAFQYFAFDIDGNDLVIAARTALVMGRDTPPRGHDSNLITFHRLTDFRCHSRTSSEPCAP
jgi:hypothetical protein